MSRGGTLHHFKKQNPNCCYCGGMKVTQSRDHVPPTGYFKNKHRPKEWEVPACNSCHGEFSIHDAFFSVLTRLNLSVSDGIGATDEPLKNLISSSHHLYAEVHRVWRENGRRVWRYKNGLIRPYVLVPLGHELVHDCVNFMLARFAAALFYKFSGKILPVGIRIFSTWQSNDEYLKGKVPIKAISDLSGYEYPKMGKKTYADQFECRHEIDEIEGQAVFAFHFHRSWLGYAFVGGADLEGEGRNMYSHSISENGLIKEKGAT